MLNKQKLNFVAPDEQLPGLYWIKSTRPDGEQIFYETGHPDLECAPRKPQEHLWMDPPKSWSPPDGSAEGAIWKYFKFRMHENCNGNDYSVNHWKKRCFHYTWQIQKGDHETSTELFLNKGDEQSPCLRGAPNSFHIREDEQWKNVEEVWGNTMKMFFSVEDVPGEDKHMCGVENDPDLYKRRLKKKLANKILEKIKMIVYGPYKMKIWWKF